MLERIIKAITDANLPAIERIKLLRKLYRMIRDGVTKEDKKSLSLIEKTAHKIRLSQKSIAQFPDGTEQIYYAGGPQHGKRRVDKMRAEGDIQQVLKDAKKK